jgi:hypothetical protein
MNTDTNLEDKVNQHLLHFARILNRSLEWHQCTEISSYKKTLEDAVLSHSSDQTKITASLLGHSRVTAFRVVYLKSLRAC